MTPDGSVHPSVAIGASPVADGSRDSNQSPPTSRCGEFLRQEPLTVDGFELRFGHIVDWLSPQLTEARLLRMKSVVQQRDMGTAVVLENIYDQGNTSAVMRTAEALGVFQFSLIQQPSVARFKAANRVTRGAEKWLDIRSFKAPEPAIEDLRRRGFKIYASSLQSQTSIEDLRWDHPAAILIGNEKDGVSERALQGCDQLFRVPMTGFSQSFNLSVAAALMLQWIHQARFRSGIGFRPSSEDQMMILANYLMRSATLPKFKLANSTPAKLNLPQFV